MKFRAQNPTVKISLCYGFPITFASGIPRGEFLVLSQCSIVLVVRMSHPNEELAAAIHRAADLLIERKISDVSRELALSLIEQANDALAQGENYSLDERHAGFLRQLAPDSGTAPIQDGESFIGFAESPYSGNGNALRPASIVYSRDGDAVSATVRLGSAFEGRPGRAHGGATAAVFDDLMGALQRITARSGYTRTLTVQYLAAVPADEHVTFRAWCTGEEGRQFFVDATATLDGKVLSTASGVFTAATF